MRRLWEVAYAGCIFVPLVMPFVVLGFLAREVADGLRIGWALSKDVSEWFTDGGAR